MQAFKVSAALAYIAIGLATLAAVFAVGAVGAGAHWRSARVLVSCAVSVVGALVAAGAQHLRQKFVFVDYVHAHHH